MKDNKGPNIIGMLVIFIIIIILGYFMVNKLGEWESSFCEGRKCHEDCNGNVDGNEELIYKLDYDPWSSTNYKCNIINLTLQRLQGEEVARATEERKECYEKGKDYDLSFDLIKDYNLSCEKIKYLNDHFLLDSDVRQSGTIKGTYNGFLSYGTLKGSMSETVYSEIVATGKLPKKAVYHLNCDNTTRFWMYQTICDDGKVFPDETGNCNNPREDLRETKKVDYYSEADYIMYYTNNCIS